MHIRRENDSIQGQFLIDPYLQSTTGRQPEQNLKLECVHGNIEADVWIAGGEGPPHYGRWKKRTSLGIHLENGTIHLKLVSKDHGNPIFKLTFHVECGMRNTPFVSARTCSNCGRPC